MHLAEKGNDLVIVYKTESELKALMDLIMSMYNVMVDYIVINFCKRKCFL